MTEKGFITANSGDTEVAGTLSIAAPRALYAVASGHKPKKNPEELLPASPADRGSGIRLIKSEDRKKDDIINRPGRSTYPREKSVLTSGATPQYLDRDVLMRRGFPHLALHDRASEAGGRRGLGDPNLPGTTGEHFDPIHQSGHGMTSLLYYHLGLRCRGPPALCGRP